MKVDAGDGHGLGWKFAKCSELGFLATTMLSSRYCCPIGELQPSAIDSAQSSYLSNLHSSWAEHQNSRRNTLPHCEPQIFLEHLTVLYGNIFSCQKHTLGEKILQFSVRKIFLCQNTANFLKVRQFLFSSSESHYFLWKVLPNPDLFLPQVNLYGDPILALTGDSAPRVPNWNKGIFQLPLSGKRRFSALFTCNGWNIPDIPTSPGYQKEILEYPARAKSVGFVRFQKCNQLVLPSIRHFRFDRPQIWHASGCLDARAVRGRSG